MATTTQIGSVSMRYGNSTNINNNLNYLFDKELILEVNTSEENNETTYKLYQILTVKSIQKRAVCQFVQTARLVFRKLPS